MCECMFTYVHMFNIKEEEKMNSKCNYDDYVDINRSTYFTLMP